MRLRLAEVAAGNADGGLAAVLHSHDGMANAYAASDLVLQLSSKPEAFGRTVIEALSIGKPVLGWNLGGVGENLQQHFSEGLVEAFDQDSLVRTAKNILENKVFPARQSLPGLADMQLNMMELYEQLAT